MTILELKNHCLSFFPRLAFNRLLLYKAIEKINESLDLGKDWDNYEKMLEISLLEPGQLAGQMNPNDVYLTHGMPCLTMFMIYTGTPISKKLQEMLISKIMNSELYNLSYPEILEREYIGLDGILGAIMALCELESYNYDNI